MTSFPDIAPDTQALVCVVTRTLDFEHIRGAGWYRLPLAHAPPALGAEYLAFYQTAAFSEARWSVRYLAQVRAVSIALRRELIPNEPNHPRAGERYFRFALGPLLQLPLAIPSRRLRRITFIPTTIGQLLQARDVVELWQSPAGASAWGDLWGAGVNARHRTLR